MYLIAMSSGDFQNPLFWAVLIGWILTVVLHEFSHGIVAYWGGDYTIRERGGLTLNPIQYVDPVGSLLLPIVFLVMGGVPLPGGVTFVRRDLLRSRAWSVAVSLAGPAMNFILFFAFVLPLHPKFKWVDPSMGKEEWTSGMVFCGAMSTLQFVAALFNLVPVPPLDGFQAISEFMNEEQRSKFSTPPLSTALFVGLFVVVWTYPPFLQTIYSAMNRMLILMGFDENAAYPGMFFNKVFFSK